MTKLPLANKTDYNQTLWGVYGEFGSGANTRVLYLQTAIEPGDLRKTTLISDIAGSETWPVPDLFQREVDNRRVTNSLLPYLQDKRKVKFFNPITLTVLPFDDKGEVLGSLPEIKEFDEERDGQSWRVLEMQGYYRYSHSSERPAWCELRWNDNKVKLVAIDGQHRLSALKRSLQDPKESGTLSGWSIPAVILAFRGDGNGAGRKSILEVVRSIFMYINKEAKPPNKSRSILLSDESINSICTQELLQRSHSNDVLDDAKRDLTLVPLLCYDWRGEEEGGQRIPSPAALQTIEEIEAWFETYVLGSDFSATQEIGLGIQPIDGPLKRAFTEGKLDADASRAVRERVRNDVVLAVAHLLQGFAPYRDYITKLRELERRYMDKSDLARHAFYRLRFGSHNAGDALHADIMSLYESLVKEIEALRIQVIKHPLDLDIGMRGVVSAFGMLRGTYNAAKRKTEPWLEYAGWFTSVLNTVYENSWFDVKGRKNVKALLRHVIEDHNETVVNYRLDEADDAFGAYVALMICAYGSKNATAATRKVLVGKREELSERLESDIMRGYKREVRPALKEQYPAGGKPLTEAVKKKAEEKTRQHMKRLDDALDEIAGA